MRRLSSISVLALILGATLCFKGTAAAGAEGNLRFSDFGDKSEDNLSPHHVDEYLCLNFQLSKQLTLRKLTGVMGERVSLFSPGRSEEMNDCPSSLAQDEKMNFTELIARGEIQSPVTGDIGEYELSENITLLPWKMYTLCQDPNGDGSMKVFKSFLEGVDRQEHSVLDWASDSVLKIDNSVHSYTPEDIVTVSAVEAVSDSNPDSFPPVGFMFETKVRSAANISTTGILNGGQGETGIAVGTLFDGGSGDVATFFEFSYSNSFSDITTRCSLETAESVGIPPVRDDIGINWLDLDDDCVPDGIKYVRFAAINEHGKVVGETRRVPTEKRAEDGREFRVSDYGVGETENGDDATVCVQFQPSENIDVSHLIGSGEDVILALYDSDEEIISDLKASVKIPGDKFESSEQLDDVVTLTEDNWYWMCQLSRHKQYGIAERVEFAEVEGVPLLNGTSIFDAYKFSLPINESDVVGEMPGDDSFPLIPFIPRIGFRYDADSSVPSACNQSERLSLHTDTGTKQSGDVSFSCEVSKGEDVDVFVFDWVHNGKHTKTTRNDTASGTDTFSMERDLPINARVTLINEDGFAGSNEGLSKTPAGVFYRAESFSPHESSSALEAASGSSPQVMGVFFEPGEDLQIEGFLASPSDTVELTGISLYNATFRDGQVEIIGEIFQQPDSDPLNRQVFFDKELTLKAGEGYVLAQKVTDGHHTVSPTASAGFTELFFNVKMNLWGPTVTHSDDLFSEGDSVNPVSDAPFPNIGFVLKGSKRPQLEQGAFLANFAQLQEPIENSYLERGYAFKVSDYVLVQGLAGGAQGGTGYQGNLYNCTLLEDGVGVAIDTKLRDVDFNAGIRREVVMFEDDVLLVPGQCYFFSQEIKDDSVDDPAIHFSLKNLDGPELEAKTHISFWNAEEDDDNRYSYSWKKDQEDYSFTSQDFAVLPDIGLVAKAISVDHITTIQEGRTAEPASFSFSGYIQSRGIMSTTVSFEYGNRSDIGEQVQTERTDADGLDGFEYTAEVSTGSLDEEVEYRIVVQPKLGKKLFGESRLPLYLEPMFPFNSLNSIPSSSVRAGIRDEFHSKSFVEFQFEDGSTGEALHEPSSGFPQETFTKAFTRLSNFSFWTTTKNVRCLEDGTQFDFSETFQSETFADFRVETTQSRYVAEGGLLRGIVFLSNLRSPEDLGVKVLGNYDPGEGDCMQSKACVQATLKGNGVVNDESTEDAFEPNDYFDEAIPLFLLGERIRLSFHEDEDIDYFALDLDEGTTLRVEAEPLTGEKITLTVYNSRREELDSKENAGKIVTLEMETQDSDIHFVKVETSETGLYDLFMDISGNKLDDIDRAVAAYGPYEATIENKGFTDSLEYGFELERERTEFDNRMKSDDTDELWKIETRLVAPSVDQPRGVTFQDDDRWTVYFTTYVSNDCTGDRTDEFDVTRERPKEFKMLAVFGNDPHKNKNSYHITVERDDKIVFGDCQPRLSSVKTENVAFKNASSVTLYGKVDSANYEKLDVRFDYGSSKDNLDASIPAAQVADDGAEFEATIADPPAPLYYKIVVGYIDTKLKDTGLEPNEVSGETMQAIEVVRTELSSVENDDTETATLKGFASPSLAESVKFEYDYESCGSFVNETDGAKETDEGLYAADVEYKDGLCYRIVVEHGSETHKGRALPVLKVKTSTVQFKDTSENEVKFKAFVDTSDNDGLFEDHVIFRYDASSNLSTSAVKTAVKAASDKTFKATANIDFDGPVFYEVIVQNPEDKFDGESPKAAEIRGGVRRALQGIETGLTSFNKTGSAILKGFVTSRMKSATNVRFRYGYTENNLNETIEAEVVNSTVGCYASVEAINQESDLPIFYTIEVEALENTFDAQNKTFQGEVLPILTVKTTQVVFNETDTVTLKAVVDTWDSQELDMDDLSIRFEYGETTSSLNEEKDDIDKSGDPVVQAAIENVGFDPVLYRVVVSKTNSDEKEVNTLRGDTEQAIEGIRTEISEFGTDGSATLAGSVSSDLRDPSLVHFAYGSHCNDLSDTREALASSPESFQSKDAVEDNMSPICYRIQVDLPENWHEKEENIASGNPLPVLTVQTATVEFDEGTDTSGRITFHAIVNTTGLDEEFEFFFEYGDSDTAGALNKNVTATRSAESDDIVVAEVDASSFPRFYEIVVRLRDPPFTDALEVEPKVVRGGIRQVVTGVETGITSFNQSGEAILRGIVSHRMKDATNVRFLYGTARDNLDKTLAAKLVDAEENVYESVGAVNEDQGPVYYRIAVEVLDNTLDAQERKTFKGGVIPVLKIYNLASKLNTAGQEKLKGIVHHSNEVPGLNIFFEYANSPEALGSQNVEKTESLDIDDSDMYSMNAETGEKRWFSIVAEQNEEFVVRGRPVELVDLRTLLTVGEVGDDSVVLRGLVSNTELLSMERYSLHFAVSKGDGEDTVPVDLQTASTKEALVVEAGKQFTLKPTDSSVEYHIVLNGSSEFDRIQGENLTAIMATSPYSEVQRNGNVQLSVKVLNSDQGVRGQTYMELLDYQERAIATQIPEDRASRFKSAFSLDSPGRPLYFRMVFEDSLGQTNVTSGPWRVLAVEGIARVSSIKLLPDFITAEVTFKGTVEEGLAENTKFWYGAERDKVTISKDITGSEVHESIAHVEARLEHQINGPLLYRLRMHQNLADNNNNEGLSNVWSVVGDFTTGDQAVLPDDFEKKFGPRKV
eukprot:gb/GECG01000886.1/.p1 GENE.gb/GECG01000886.1/~~gb/GECG01000886.1/.p1  ORF type:complete len:2690 (+),score=405.19 gb/GECG01000886.1/:1-8070(+)